MTPATAISSSCDTSTASGRATGTCRRSPAACTRGSGSIRVRRSATSARPASRPGRICTTSSWWAVGPPIRAARTWAPARRCPRVSTRPTAPRARRCGPSSSRTARPPPPSPGRGRRADPGGGRPDERRGRRRAARLGRDPGGDRDDGGSRCRAGGAVARALWRGTARRGHRRARRPGRGARLGRELRARPARAGAPRARPGRPHRDLHRRRPRRQPRRARRGRRTRHRRARGGARRDRVGRGRVARRPPPPARRGARRRHRGARPARGTVHAARGPDVHRLTLGLAALRATGVGALLLLIWNPTAVRLGVGDAPRLVLLDASLSMAGQGGHWAAALDTARALARGDVIWRFGARVTAFDTLAPRDGATRLAPALAAAAARGGPVAIVTDGAISDRTDAPADLLRFARIVVLPRTPFFDAFVSDVTGPSRIAAGDTLRLRVSYGTAGKRETGNGKGTAVLGASVAGRRIVSRVVNLPDSGIVSTDLTFPVSRFPFPGWVAVDVRLEGVSDSEPRDDARTVVLQVSAPPSIVLLAAPPDWDTRFLAHALEDVAQAAVKVFVAADPGGTRWRDAATLAAVRPGERSEE